MAAFLMNCGGRTATCPEKEKGNSQQVVNYVVDKSVRVQNADFAGDYREEGLVPTADVAFQVAEPILRHLYGSDIVERGKPFSINLVNGVWLIRSHLMPLGPNELGESPFTYIEIRKSDGAILKVLHGM